MWITLYEGGLVKKEPQFTFDAMPVEESENTSNQISKEEEVNENFLKIEREKISNYVKYTFDFGKCKEKQRCDVDKDYQDWILKTKKTCG